MILESFFLLTISLITAGGIIFWIRHFQQSPEPQNSYLEKQYSSPIGMFDFVIGFFVWFGLPAVALTVLSSHWGLTELTNLDSARRNTLMISLAMSQLFGGLIIMAILRVRYGPLKWFLGDFSDWITQFWLAWKCFCMVVPLVLAIQALLSALVPYEHETLNQLADNFTLTTMLTASFGAVIVAPVCEELVFRGLLQSWLQRIDFHRSDQERIYEFVGGWDEPLPMEKKEPVVESIRTRRIRWWAPIIIKFATFCVDPSRSGSCSHSVVCVCLGARFCISVHGQRISVYRFAFYAQRVHDFLDDVKFVF